MNLETASNFSIASNELIDNKRDLHFSLGINSSFERIVYSVRWTSVDKFTVSYMENRESAVKMHEAHSERFKHILRQCVEAPQIACRVNLKHKNIDSSCVDD